MRSRRKTFLTAGVVLGGGLLFAPMTTCSSFVGESMLTSTNFCFIFDCQNGFFGGTVDPCSGQGSGNSTLESADGTSFFRDCPTTQ